MPFSRWMQILPVEMPFACDSIERHERAACERSGPCGRVRVVQCVSERSAEFAPEDALDLVPAKVADATCSAQIFPGSEAKVLVRPNPDQKRGHRVGQIAVD